MHKMVLGASVALLLFSQPTTSQTLGTGHKPNASSIGTGQAKQPGGAVPSRYTALGAHAGLGSSPTAIVIGQGLARPAAVAVPSGFPAVGGVAPLGARGVVPAVPLGRVGTNSGATSIGTNSTRPTTGAIPSSVTVVRGGTSVSTAVSAPPPAPAAVVSGAAVGTGGTGAGPGAVNTGGSTGPSATGRGSTSGVIAPATVIASSGVATSVTSTAVASTAVLPLPVALRSRQLPLPAQLRPLGRGFDRSTVYWTDMGVTNGALNTVVNIGQAQAVACRSGALRGRAGRCG